MTYKNILLPTDGSENAGRAIRHGIALARALGASVTGFHAAPPVTPVEYRGILPKLVDMNERKAKIEQQTARHLKVVEDAARRAGVRCRVYSTTNDFAADAIVAAAKRYRCDLIFIATHGRRSRRGVLLGSNTQKVLNASPVPVLLDR